MSEYINCAGCGVYISYGICWGNLCPACAASEMTGDFSGTYNHFLDPSVDYTDKCRCCGQTKKIEFENSIDSTEHYFYNLYG